MKLKKGLWLLIFLVSAAIFLGSLGALEDQKTKFSVFGAAPAVALFTHTSNEPPAGPILVAKANSLAPSEQEGPNCENNLPPIADAGGPYEAIFNPGESFTILNLGGNSSFTDPDGKIDDFLWEIDSDSGRVLSKEKFASFKFLNPGQYRAKFTVTDNCGSTGSDTVEVTILEDNSYSPLSTSCNDAEIELISQNYDQDEFYRLAPGCLRTRGYSGLNSDCRK